MDRFAAQLADWNQRGLERKTRVVRGHHGPTIVLDENRVINFSSNNYLGFADHPIVNQAAHQAIESCGTGVGASRLIVGTNSHHAELERSLARFHNVEAALVFNSGYCANIGCIPALVGPGDLILSDQLNHASIIDGCRLSRAETIVFSHKSAVALEEKLLAHRSRYRRAMVVTDSVFSMDGDIAPVRELAALCAKYDAIFMVDEAHATGVLGPDGKGICAALGCVPDIQMGTLSKALGCFGGYVAGSNTLIQLLKNTARSFAFTTGLPPNTVAAANASLHLTQGSIGETRRKQLTRHIQDVSNALGTRGLLMAGVGKTPIFPILVGETTPTMACCQALLEMGVFIQGIRPPTVPRGTSRLRLTLMASHTPEHIDRLIHSLDQLQVHGLLNRH